MTKIRGSHTRKPKPSNARKRKSNSSHRGPKAHAEHTLSGLLGNCPLGPANRPVPLESTAGQAQEASVCPGYGQIPAACAQSLSRPAPIGDQARGGSSGTRMQGLPDTPGPGLPLLSPAEPHWPPPTHPPFLDTSALSIRPQTYSQEGSLENGLLGLWGLVNNPWLLAPLSALLTALTKEVT